MKQLLMITTFLTAMNSLSTHAQPRAHLYMNQLDAQWNMPIVVDSIEEISISSQQDQLLFDLKGQQTIPFSIQYIDSLTFENEPAQESKDPYQVFQLYIHTIDGAPILSRDYYTNCHVALNAKGAYTSYSTNAQIRGRGNSTFLWYEKKPYRLKLNDKHKLLGLDKAKSWVLLANYRDVTDMMNTFVFEMGRALGLPYTNHSRYVELFMNGEYEGIYQLTEQVQQHQNRVAISKERGILLTLDVDDGPDENPWGGDNFWSAVYHMPVCVKYPDDEAFTVNTVDSVKSVLAELETAIKSKDYAKVEQLLDIPSFIKYLQIQEFIYNVELSAPRSIFMHKDGDDKWVMGPLWDFDAGYDFDWSNMYTGHDYFANYTETVMGTDPLHRNGQYGYVPKFFTDLFACKEFVDAYKAQWDAVKDTIVDHCWEECQKYADQLRLSGASIREYNRWPLQGKRFDSELKKMKRWLQNRQVFFSSLVAAIPDPKGH